MAEYILYLSKSNDNIRGFFISLDQEIVYQNDMNKTWLSAGSSELDVLESTSSPGPSPVIVRHLEKRAT